MAPRYLIAVPITLGAIAVWVTLCFLTVDRGWLRPAITDSQDPAAFADAAISRIGEQARGNLALVLIENGAVVAAHNASMGAPINGDTRFQVASMSKWLSAWGVMVLVQDGLIDLDAPVANYLTRWRLPQSSFDNNGVTVRRLLSHTAGLDDGLGYAGFAASEPIQTLEQSLTQARDASPGANGAVRVAEEPGAEWNYSGGGYTLLQLLIEEVSGQSFERFMAERVFSPLGMNDTTFAPHDLDHAPVAENFNTDGEIEPLRRYTSLAATSLYTTANDMSRFLAAQSPRANPVGGGVLSPATLTLMREPHGRQMGVPIWGLGVMLYAANNGGDFIVGHDGSNEPAINTAARLDPATGDGIVILETGNPLLATEIAGEWVFWKTGNVDFLDFTLAVPTMLIAMITGSVLLSLAGFLLGLNMRRRLMRARPNLL